MKGMHFSTKNAHLLNFWISQLAISTQRYFETIANSEINIRIIFRGGVCVHQVFWCYDFYSNNSEVFHIMNWTNKLKCLTLESFSSLMLGSILAYWADLKVTKKM